MKNFVFRIVVILASLIVVGVLGCPSPVTPTSPTTTHGTTTRDSSAEESYNRGCELLDEGEYDEAIDEFTKAIELDPAYADAYSNRGWAYAITEQYDRAIADYNRAIELDPQNASVYVYRG
ncbi:MAG: tetratricopeptide repeat protein [Chloroflexi bacterium]|nr:tetratricopeptide repeat protein [Chloroflexota bacterium]